MKRQLSKFFKRLRPSWCGKYGSLVQSVCS